MLAAYPMHGQHKLSQEGYRTRDGHIIEWCGRLLPESDTPVRVFSRPEPIILKRRRTYDPRSVAAGTEPHDRWILSVPRPWDPKRWWVTSASKYSRPVDLQSACIIWNPLLGLNVGHLRAYNTVAVDLLDDWTKHAGFASIGSELERAYKHLFERADLITANSEGTVALARRFGRDDVKLILNGCDPERFSLKHTRGPRPCVGYVGKIGHRLDVAAIELTASRLPDVDFLVAGPVLEREVGERLSRFQNVSMLGDVHYDQMPRLLERFDIGWVPHGLGSAEVGGDVIKTYEYRAAGLPVLTTPVVGAGKRGLSHVHVVPGEEHADWISDYLKRNPSCDRTPESIPEKHTWRYKTTQILEGISGTEGSGR